jgi:hypothetical protein
VRDLLAVAGDRHVLAPLDEVEQVTEFALRLERTELRHGGSCTI